MADFLKEFMEVLLQSPLKEFTESFLTQFLKVFVHKICKLLPGEISVWDPAETNKKLEEFYSHPQAPKK